MTGIESHTKGKTRVFKRVAKITEHLMQLGIVSDMLYYTTDVKLTRKIEALTKECCNKTCH